MKKLKMSSLTITLYVFTLLSLAYTVYFIYTTYESLSTYYASYGLTTSEYIAYIFQNCFTPFGFTVVLYGLAGISDMLYKILKPATKENEEVKEEKVEEVKEENSDTSNEEVQDEKAEEEIKEESTKENETEE